VRADARARAREIIEEFPTNETMLLELTSLGMYAQPIAVDA
jgi:hypothetical protein